MIGPVTSSRAHRRRMELFLDNADGIGVQNILGQRLLPINGQFYDKAGITEAKQMFDKFYGDKGVDKIYTGLGFSGDFASKNQNIKAPEISKNVLYSEKRKGLLGLLGMKKKTSPVDVAKDIHLHHEGNEVRYTGKAIKSLNKGKDTVTPSGHFHPDVLFNEHNVLRTLEMPAAEKESLIRHFSKAREANGDLGPINKTLGRLGEYGTGMKINRSMRKHLGDSLLKNYYKE